MAAKISPPPRYDVVAKAVKRGESYQSIAERLGTTRMAVQKAVQRARKYGALPPFEPRGADARSLLPWTRYMQRQRSMPPCGTVANILRGLPLRQRDALLRRLHASDDTLSQTFARIITEALDGDQI